MKEYEVGNNDYDETTLDSINAMMKNCDSPAWLLKLTEEKTKCIETIKQRGNK